MARRRVPHALPSEASPAGDFARGLALLVGPAVQAPPGSCAEADYLAKGDLLAALSATTNAAQAQAFAPQATQLLADWEAVYGLPSDGALTTAQRQARLAAAVLAGRSGSAQAIAAMARVYDATAAVYENTPASVSHAPTVGADDGLLPGTSRAVFQFAIRVAAATFADPLASAAIAALGARMKPAHTGFVLCTNDPGVGFLCDDAGSLTDRDVLGL